MGKWSCVVRLVDTCGFKLDLSKFKDKLLLQKLVYIAQKLFNMNLGYKFSWYYYGPYSRGLALDAGKYGFGTSDVCELNLSDLGRFIEFMNDVKKLGNVSYWVELIASYVMLSTDVYPRPKDPIKELVSKKKHIKVNDVIKGIELLKKYGIYI